MKPHVFIPDPDLPPDPLDRRKPPARPCRDCGRTGRPDDANHKMPDPVPDAQSAAAGEN